MFKGGYHGRYVMVDLTSKSYSIKDLPENLAEQYLGGRGIGTKLLYDLQPGQVDPLSPENHLIIFHRPAERHQCSRNFTHYLYHQIPLQQYHKHHQHGRVFPQRVQAYRL